MAQSTHELHQVARTWALKHLGLEERDGDDRLYNRRGQSYAVEARTNTGRATSFDFSDPPSPFGFLVGVLVNPDGRTVDDAFKVNRFTFDRLAHRNEGTVRFRISDSGDEGQHVEWLM